MTSTVYGDDATVCTSGIHRQPAPRRRRKTPSPRAHWQRHVAFGMLSVMTDAFRRFAHAVSLAAGAPMAFAAALGVILAWALTGPVFGFSDTWQLVINTGTTIVTFLMVFLIQNTQNRDARAMQLKLDELINSTARARNRLVDIEDVSDEELDLLQREFKEMHDREAGVIATELKNRRQRSTKT